MPLQLWADVYNAAGVRQGAGPITTISQASIKRVLDNAGTITFTTPVLDERALSLLTIRARVRLFLDDGNGGRELCRGIILERKIQESASGRSMQFTCIDTLGELKDANTLMGRAYSQQAVSTVIAALLGLSTGWTSSIETTPGAQLIDARFDGASVLKALQQIVKITGYHFRLGTGTQLEFGEFGTLSSTYLLNVAHISEVADNTNVALIDSISVEDDGEDLVNTIIPLGAGTDAAALKLKKSTRTTPYTIQNATGPNGKQYWYIADSTSISAYGTITKVVTIPEIAPLSNTAADKVNAANQLYDAAAAYLERAAILKKTYKVTLQAVRTTLKPGDKINIRYKGIAYRDGVELDYLDLNDDFWILSVNETISPTGRAVSITISNTDTEPKSAVGKMIEVMEDVQIQRLKPTTGTYCRTFVYDRSITPSINAKVSVLVTDTTLELIRAKVKFETFAAEYHRHLVFYTSSPTTAPSLTDYFSALGFDVDGNASESIILANYAAASANLYTDTQNKFLSGSIFPVNIGVIIDGTDRTTALGGPWQPSSSAAIEVDLDVDKVTSYFNADLYRKHTLEFYCTSYEGRIEITVELYEVGQSITLDI